jgi:hypothetical protein
VTTPLIKNRVPPIVTRVAVSAIDGAGVEKRSATALKVIQDFENRNAFLTPTNEALPLYP